MTTLYSKLGDEFLLSINKRKYHYLSVSPFLVWALIKSTTLFEKGLKGRYESSQRVDQWPIGATIQTLLLNRTSQNRQYLMTALFKMTDSDVKGDVAKQLISTSIQDPQATDKDKIAQFDVCYKWLEGDFVYYIHSNLWNENVFFDWALTNAPKVIEHYVKQPNSLNLIVTNLLGRISNGNYGVLDPLFKSIDIDLATKLTIATKLWPSDSFNKSLTDYLYGQLGEGFESIIPIKVYKLPEAVEWAFATSPKLLKPAMQDEIILRSIVLHYLDHNDYSKLDPLFNIADITMKKQIVKIVMPDSFQDKLITYLYSKLGLELGEFIPVNYLEQNLFLHYVLSSKPELLKKVLNFVSGKCIFSLITKLTLEEEFKKYFVGNKDLLSHLGSWCSYGGSFMYNVLHKIDQKDTKEMIEFLFKHLPADDFKQLILPLGRIPYSGGNHSIVIDDMDNKVPSIVEGVIYGDLFKDYPKEFFNHLKLFTEIDGGCLFRELKLLTLTSKVGLSPKKTDVEKNVLRLDYLQKLYKISHTLFVEEANKAPTYLSNLARDDKNQDLETWLKEINLWQDKTE